MLNPLFIIPARGGSKGIPHKNIKLLGGKPLIAYSIDVAKGLTSDVSRIILSTDDEQIAQVARECGLPVEYMRPAEFATDRSGSREVMLDAMHWAEKKGIAYDCVVLLQPTSPLRTVDDVRAAMDLYNDQLDMVVSVSEARSNPYYNSFEVDPTTGYLHVSKGEGLFTRRQDAPEAWEYTGAVYVINPESLKREALGAFKRRRPSPMPSERSIDLDSLTDWMVAEMLLKEKK